MAAGSVLGLICNGAKSEVSNETSQGTALSRLSPSLISYTVRGCFSPLSLFPVSLSLRCVCARGEGGNAGKLRDTFREKKEELQTAHQSEL